VNTNATSLDIEVDNIRRRWYEIAVSTVGTTVPSQIRLLGPENRGFWSRILLNDVSVRPGASIAIFADGQSLLALGMHVLDLVVTAVTGKPVPGDLIDDALLIANGINCPFGFGASVGAHLAQGNVPEILKDIRSLPKLASEDRCLRDALLTLRISETELATLENVANIIKLTSVIARELETLTAPQFDNVSLVAR
jgi:hypothetical protein